MTTPAFYARPEGPAMELRIAPRLASWNVARHPDQVRLVAALDDAEELLGPAVDALSGPVALRLDVGLGEQVDLLHEHDLDNYVFAVGGPSDQEAPATDRFGGVDQDDLDPLIHPLRIGCASVAARRRGRLPGSGSHDPLGRTQPHRDWHPRDGRITELGLHCRVDKDLGHDVAVTVAARSIS